MNIIQGFGLCDPEVLCMDVVSANTISRLAVKFWLLFSLSLELHVFVTSRVEYNLAKYFFPQSSPMVLSMVGIFCSLALVMLTVPCRGSAALRWAVMNSAIKFIEW